MSLRQVTAASVLGLLATAALAACGGGGTPSNGAAAPPPAAVGPSSAVPATSAGAVAPAGKPGAAATTAPNATACADAPSGVVGRALGLAVGKLVASAGGPVTVCAYTGRYEVVVRYQAGEDASQFTQYRQSVAMLHQSVSQVGGLGDQAFFASYTVSKPASYTLAARKNGTAVFITAPVSLDAERALMAELLQKL
jgi:hypothetical protein